MPMHRNLCSGAYKTWGDGHLTDTSPKFSFIKTIADWKAAEASTYGNAEVQWSDWESIRMEKLLFQIKKQKCRMDYVTDE